MTRFSNSKIAVFILLFVMMTLTVSVDVYARAGGGGGGGGGHGSGHGNDGTARVIQLVILAGVLVNVTGIYLYIMKRRRESRALLERLAYLERSWNPDDIRTQVEMVYFKVQEAWTKRDQSIARDYMSDKLYRAHKMKTDEMIRAREVNVLKDIKLLDAGVVGIEDYRDDSKDTLWVYIKGSMVDYMIAENPSFWSGARNKKTGKFTELWKFIRGPKGWVLDEIDDSVSILDMKKMRSFSEEFKR